MSCLLLLQQDPDESQRLARLFNEKGFMVAQARDQAGARSILASSAPVELVIAGADCHDRAKLLSGLWQARPNVPVIFLAASSLPETKRDSVAHERPSIRRDLKFQTKIRPIRVEEIDRIIRIAACKRRLNSRRTAAA